MNLNDIDMKKILAAASNPAMNTNLSQKPNLPITTANPADTNIEVSPELPIQAQSQSKPVVARGDFNLAHKRARGNNYGYNYVGASAPPRSNYTSEDVVAQATTNAGVSLSLDSAEKIGATSKSLMDNFQDFLNNDSVEGIRGKQGLLAAVRAGVKSFGVSDESLPIVNHQLNEMDKQLEANALREQIGALNGNASQTNSEGGAGTAVGEQTTPNGATTTTPSGTGTNSKKTSPKSKLLSKESKLEGEAKKAPTDKKLSKENIFSGLLKTFTGQISDGELRVLRDAAEHAKAKQLQDEKLFAEDKRLDKTLNFQKYQTEIKAELDRLGIRLQVADLGLRTYQAVNQAENLTTATKAQAASLYSSAELNNMHALAAGIIQVQPENIILSASKSDNGKLNLRSLTDEPVSSTYINALTNMQREAMELANFYMEFFGTENPEMAQKLALDAIENGPLGQKLEALKGTSITINEIIDGEVVRKQVETKDIVTNEIFTPAVDNMANNYTTFESVSEWDNADEVLDLDYTRAFMHTLGYEWSPTKTQKVSFSRNGYTPEKPIELNPNDMGARERVMLDILNSKEVPLEALQLNPRMTRRMTDRDLKKRATDSWNTFYSKLEDSLSISDLANYLAQNPIGTANLSDEYFDINTKAIASKNITQIKEGETLIIKGIPFKCVTGGLKVTDKRFKVAPRRSFPRTSWLPDDYIIDDK